MSNFGKENSSENFTLDANKSKIAERIKIVVDKVGGATAFSELSGVSVSSLGNYTSGRSEPKASILFLVSKIGNVSTDWLITGEDRPQISKDLVMSDIDKAILHDVIYLAIRLNRIRLDARDTITDFTEELAEEYNRLYYKKHRK